MRPAGHLFQGHVRRTSAQRRSQRAVQSTLAFVGLLAVFGCELSPPELRSTHVVAQPPVAFLETL